MATISRTATGRWLVTVLVSIVVAGSNSGCAGSQDHTTSKRSTAQPKSGDQLLRAGIDAETAGDARAAENNYRHALRVRPDHLETADRLVNFMINQGRPDEAILVAKSVLDRNPTNQPAYHLMARAQISAGAYGNARRTLDDLLEQHKNDALAYHTRGHALAMLQKHTAAVVDLRTAVRLAPGKFTFLVSLGSVLHRIGRLDEAVEILGAALKLQPDNARAHLLMGMVLRESYKAKEAVTHHRRAVQYAATGRGFYELALSQLALGDGLGSQQSLQRAVTLAPRNATYWYAYGEIFRQTKEWSQAISAYRRVLVLQPRRKLVRNKLGLALFMLHKYPEAISVLKQAIRIHPSRPYPYFNLGMAYEKLRNYDAAIQAFRKFLSLAPKLDGDRPIASTKLRLLKSLRRRAKH